MEEYQKIMEEYAARAAEKNDGYTRTWTASLSYKTATGINFSPAELATNDLLKQTLDQAVAEAAEYVQAGFSRHITVQVWKTTKAHGTREETGRHASVYRYGGDILVLYWNSSKPRTLRVKL
jgi:hypothetical protein